MTMFRASTIFFSLAVLIVPSVILAEGVAHGQTYEDMFGKTFEEARMAGIRDIFSMVPYVSRMEKAGVEIDVPFLRKVASTGNHHESRMA